MTDGWGDRVVELGGRESWTAAERRLFDSALAFYGAAGAVVELHSADRPRLRYDVAGLQAVRDAMAALQERIREARAAGLGVDRITGITRLERDLVESIAARG